MSLLRRNHDPVHVAFYGHQRTRLDVVVTAVLYQIFYGRTRFREKLDFVENYQGFSGDEPDVVICRKIRKERIQIAQMVFEKISYVVSGNVEIYDYVRFVFILREFFYDIAFPDTSRPVYKEGSSVRIVAFPFKQFVVYFSPHTDPLSRFQDFMRSLFSRFQEKYCRFFDKKRPCINFADEMSTWRNFTQRVFTT